MLVIRADLVDGSACRGSAAVAPTGGTEQVVESYMFGHTGADDVPDHR